MQNYHLQTKLFLITQNELKNGLKNHPQNLNHEIITRWQKLYYRSSKDNPFHRPDFFTPWLLKASKHCHIIIYSLFYKQQEILMGAFGITANHCLSKLQTKSKVFFFATGNKDFDRVYTENHDFLIDKNLDKPIAKNIRKYALHNFFTYSFNRLHFNQGKKNFDLFSKEELYQNNFELFLAKKIKKIIFNRISQPLTHALQNHGKDKKLFLTMTNKQYGYLTKFSNQETVTKQLKSLSFKKLPKLQHISKNSTEKLKQSFILISKQIGKITFTPIDITNKDYFKETFKYLVKFNQKRFNKRQNQSAFTNIKFKKFLYQLLLHKPRFVSLIKISAQSKIIGILVNFHHENKIYQYQSGFNYGLLTKPDNKLRPGFLCCFLAMAYYKKHNYQEFDFMLGHKRYKQSLANHSYSSYSYIVQKKTPLNLMKYLLKKYLFLHSELDADKNYPRS